MMGMVGLAAGGLIRRYLLAQHSYKASTPPSSPSSYLGSLLYIYRNHSKEVVGVAWSPDGTRIASASYDHTVQVWDAANGGHIYTYRGHSAQVHSVEWSPDSARIASASADKTVQVWDATIGGHAAT